MNSRVIDIFVYMYIWEFYLNTIDMDCFLFETAHGFFKEILDFSVTLENNNNGCCLRNGIFV